MSVSGVNAMPHHILTRRPWLTAAATTLSLLLSLWAIYQDPVINRDGILYVEAAGRFIAGQWSAGLTIYKWPFYSLIIAALSQITGLAAGHAAYLATAALYALIVLGFVALVRSLGGRDRVLWLAALVALGHPVLNEFRPFIIRDVGYWACYLWSAAYYLTSIRHNDPRLLLAGGVLGAAAFLFRIEGIVLVTLLPAAILAARDANRARAALIMALGVLVSLAAFALAPLWQYVSMVKISTGELLAEPVHHLLSSWALLGDTLGDRLAMLQREFPGMDSGAATLSTYLAVAGAMVVLNLLKSLGVVFGALVIYVCWTGKRLVDDTIRPWWWLLVAIQLLLILQFGLSNFFLAKRYPVALALTLLPVVPLALADIWRRFAARGRPRDWRVGLLAALLIVESVEGLNLATNKDFLKDAGLWLRQHAAAGSSLYSNSRILNYYAGLADSRPANGHSWQQAMREVWTDNWRRHDWFVLVMDSSRRQNEVLLYRRIGTQPVKTFSNPDDDQVLIFRDR